MSDLLLLQASSQCYFPNFFFIALFTGKVGPNVLTRVSHDDDEDDVDDEVFFDSAGTDTTVKGNEEGNSARKENVRIDG